MRKKVFAHRGSSGTHPENTLAAINDAIAAGVDGIEIDVQKTKDGRLVIIHDEAVDRTTNDVGFIKDMLFDEVRRLDAGSWFSPQYKHERIPELDEVLQMIQGTSIQLNIELKNNLIEYPQLEEDVYHALKDHNMIEQVIISSFNHHSLAKFSRLSPEIACAVLTEEPINHPKEYLKQLGATSVHCNLKTYQQMVNTEDGNALNYRIFTLNDRDELVQWGKQNAYDIFTDYPRNALIEKSKLTSGS